MKLVGKSIIGKKKAKEQFEYPIIRFPLEYKEIIGKEAKIYEIDKNKFLISIDENELSNELDNSYVLVKVDKNLLQKAKELGIDINEFLEDRLEELLNEKSSAAARIRTWDHRLNRPTLYQLSYGGSRRFSMF